LNADRGIDSAREIREYFIPDFSHCKDHDSYAKAFDRLLRDLKADARDRTMSSVCIVAVLAQYSQVQQFSTLL
jgi:hypothetical protein